MSRPILAWHPEIMPDLSGCVVVVTGANSGLGYQMSLHFARRGAQVVMACRNIARARQAAHQIASLVPGAKMDQVELNLADLESVRQAAETIRSRHPQLDVLVNNAGVMFLPHAHSVDGFETQMASNHLGHFLLTGLLLPALQRVPASRVVSMTSGFNRFGRLPASLIDFKQAQSKYKAYCDSKLANLVFIRQLARRLQETGSSTIAVAAHPGYAATNLQFGLSNAMRSPLMARLHRVAMRMSNRMLAQSADMGAWPAMYAAVHDEVRNGDYIGPDGFLALRGHPRVARVPRQALSERDAVRLWTLSEQACGFRYGSHAQSPAPLAKPREIFSLPPAGA